MKKLYLRSCVALACALSLGACGGGDGNLSISGSVSGLTKTGLVLQNNGGQDFVVLVGATSFIFPERVAGDTGYNVTVKTQPTGAFCTPINNTGTTGSYSITNILISCVTEKRVLGGQIRGLKVNSQMVIVNGADKLNIAGTEGATAPAIVPTFVMPMLVPDGEPYGVTILTQPANQTCTISENIGTMGAVDLPTVVRINCI
ncbi:hypothetical protein [Massilia glaciei]|nr:hypothetical protein [Massilia glaciei]